VRRHLEISWLLIRNSLIREMSFKANFLLWIAVDLLWFVGQLVFIEVLFRSIDRIGDWSKWEVILLFGTHQIVAQIFQAFFYINIANLPELVRTGRLDLMLVLPVDTQFAVSSRQFGPDNMVNAFVGACVVGFSLGQLHVSPGPAAWVLYVTAILFGVTVHYAIMFSFAVASFWIMRAQGLIFGYFHLFNLARYPAGIFPGPLRILLSSLIPVLLVTNVPASALARSAETPWRGLIALGTATVFVVFASRLLWRRALRRYSSASS
jgi:ABC-2 type transport system permease protein